MNFNDFFHKIVLLLAPLREAICELLLHYNTKKTKKQTTKNYTGLDKKLIFSYDTERYRWKITLAKIDSITTGYLAINNIYPMAPSSSG